MISRNRNIILFAKLIKRVGIGLFLVNIISQKIFRINNARYILHFTSKHILPNRIQYDKDLTTLVSFAVSGGCYFQALNGIEIGKNFLFAPGVKLISSNHGFTDRSEVRKSKPIKIGDNVWLGANVIILPGVEIGNNVVVGAGSVVTKSFRAENLIIAGNPAKIIGKHSPESL